LLKVTEPQTTTVCGSFVYSARPASINNKAADSPAAAFCFEQNFHVIRAYYLRRKKQDARSKSIIPNRIVKLTSVIADKSGRFKNVNTRNALFNLSRAAPRSPAGDGAPALVKSGRARPGCQLKTVSRGYRLVGEANGSMGVAITKLRLYT
jgi:hypothetical protein